MVSLEEKVTMKLLEVLPNITVIVSVKRGHLRLHFKAEEQNFVPSKALLCNMFNIPEYKVKVNFKCFDDGMVYRNCPGKMFSIYNGEALVDEYFS